MTAALSIAVYLLCAATSLACAVLLLRGYRRNGARFLLWSSLCFIGLTLNNVILFVDQVVLPQVSGLAGVEFPIWRSAVAVVGIVLLLYGLVWDAE
jgi:Family of unknown function (DUF5985)